MHASTINHVLYDSKEKEEPNQTQTKHETCDA